MITEAHPEKIWKVWTDVEGWAEWDTEIEYATIDGVFQEGQTGTLKPKGAAEAKYYLSNVRENVSFTTHVLLPGNSQLENWHIIVDKKDGTSEMTHGVRMKGILSWVFSVLLGGKYSKALPDVMDKVRAAAGDTSERKIVGLDGQIQQEREARKESRNTESENEEEKKDNKQEHVHEILEESPKVEDDPIIKV